MIDPLFQGSNYQLASKLLDAAMLRQQAIASNLAHADTPGYKRVDLAPDFAQQLATELERGGPAALKSLAPALAEDKSARSVRPDGNSVEIENELLAMNRNSVDYEYLTEIVSGSLKQLRLAITGRSA